MHQIGCPQRNNPYGDCKCAEMDMREHTEQLRLYNQNYVKLNEAVIANADLAEMVSKQSEEIARLKAALEKIATLRDGKERLCEGGCQFIAQDALAQLNEPAKKQATT